VADDVIEGVLSRAIIFGKSGQGEAIMANRFLGVRAALYYGGNLEIIKLSREHNDANVLSLAGGFVSFEEAKEAVKLWSETPFSGDSRHQYRIEKIDEIAADFLLDEEAIE
jgi:ribose 5-phosphate isomerase B